MPTPINPENPIKYSPLLQAKHDILSLFEKNLALIKEQLSGAHFTHGANFEKLNAGGSEQAIYSMRLNNKARLLLTSVGKGSDRHWLLLDILENHQYDTSPFLKPGYLKDYLAKKSTEHSRNEPIARNSTTPSTSPSSASSSGEAKSDIHPIHLEHYNEQFIVLNDEQLGAVRAPQPLVVSGMPGSGKSCVAISILRQHVDALEDIPSDVPKKALYVTSSPRLVEQMKRTWHSSAQEHGESKSSVPDDAQVEFKTYAELLGEQAGELVGKDCCADWLAEYLKPKNKSSLVGRLKEGLSSSLDLHASIYQEFRIMSALDKNVYQQLGANQCLFHDKAPSASSASSNSASAASSDARSQLWGLFETYKTHLKDNKKSDLGLTPLVSDSMYSQIVVDEAQDFSPLQLECIAKLAENNQITYLIDSNQSLNDNLSKLPFLKGLLAGKDKSFNHIELPYTFRCSKAVAEVANKVLGLKYHITGGLLDKSASSEVKASEGAVDGSVAWYEKPGEQMKDAGQSTKIAVICSEEFISEARQQFPGAIVLTPKQVKGLEYDTIIAYRLFEQPIFKALNTLAEGYEAGSKSVGRGKGEDARHEYGPSLNEVFTAFTRARAALVIINNESHDTRHILGAVKGKDAQATKPAAESCSQVAQSSKEEWEREIKRQYDYGNQEEAWRLYKAHIAEHTEEEKKHHERAPFDALVGRGLAHQPKKTIDENTFVRTNDSVKINAGGAGEATPAVEEKKLKPAYSTKTPVSLPQKPPSTPVSADKATRHQSYINKFISFSDPKVIEANLASLLDNKNAKTLLYETPAGQCDNLFQWICENQQKIDGPDYNTPGLVCIAAMNGHTEVLKLLAKAGANLNKSMKNGMTPAIVAAANGLTEVLRVLAKAGADLNKSMKNGMTPAIVAATNGHTEVISLFAEAGVDLNKPKNDDGLTPAIVAAANGHTEVLRVLAKADVDLNKPRNDGGTPAGIAAAKGDTEVLEVLVEAGADINKPNSNGATPALVAAGAGRIGVIRLLAKAGADFNLSMKKTSTSLKKMFMSSSEKFKSRMERFIGNMPDKNNILITPKDMADMMGHKKIVKLLSSLSAKASNSLTIDSHEETKGDVSRAQGGAGSSCNKAASPTASSAGFFASAVCKEGVKGESEETLSNRHE